MNVGICALIKDCNPKYLNEWLNHHRGIGVDYFFIYDNESKVPLAETVENSKGVQVIVFPGKVQQLNAYNDCIRKQQNGIRPCDWIAFIDDDEFITLETGTIKTLLAQHRDSGLGLNWILFGSSDPDKMELPQTEKYTRHLPLEHQLNRHIKSIVKPSTVLKFVNPHWALLRKGINSNVKGIRVEGAFVGMAIQEGAWINHYYCRSRNEYEQKIERGRSDIVGTNLISYFEELDQLATTPYKKLNQMMPPVKKVVQMRNVKGITALESLIAELDVRKCSCEMTMVEIGSYAGESTEVFAKNFKRVISIDPFQDNYDPKDPTCQQAPFEQVYRAFQDRMKPYTNVEHLRMTSDEAVMEIPEVDFIYIDGCHTFEQVKKDIENYTPRLKPGGVIGGHDYVGGWAGVRKAVDECLGKPDKIYEDGSWLKFNPELQQPIAIITPTGGRPDQIRLCAEFMRAQTYPGKVIWVVVDDCDPVTADFIREDFRPNWEIIHVNPFPRWKEGHNTQSRNLQTGIDEVKRHRVKAVFIVEDDDYYSPKYLSVMEAGLRGYDVVGETDTLYFHVGIFQGNRSKNRKHASLFQTGFTPRMIPVFEEVLKRNEKFIDINFFSRCTGVQFLHGLDLAIGIKGLPGRKGIGMGHSPRIYTPAEDNTTERQKQTLNQIYR